VLDRGPPAVQAEKLEVAKVPTMTSPTLVQLIYVSAARSLFSDEELAELLRVCRSNNAKQGITGLLLYEQGSFLQVLEGRPDKVHPLFDKISRDPRHHRVMRIIETPVAAPSFGEWSMGYARLSSRDGAKPPGYSDFFDEVRAGRNPPAATVARQVLDAFRSGRWHVYVEG
jgi:hypothetical protein